MMARQRRIEYEGAIYHVMARGDRREDIVKDDIDRERFEETLEEVVARSGWVLYGWVLMGNHYHFLFKTPEANLVAGMTWFQATWTSRFNHRHRLWGHLFGGRYKAIPVEDGAYLTRLIHYIHLNPVRAGLVKKQDGLESYRWSSLSDYLKPKRKRRSWVDVERGLENMELADTVAGRREFLKWTEDCVNWREKDCAGVWEEDGQSLQSTLRRGWYFGEEAFRESLLKLLAKSPVKLREGRSQGYVGRQTRDHGISEAERLIEMACEVFGVEEDEWGKMRKGDWRKGVVAGMIRERSLVDNGWLAERLHMGARNAVSRTIKEAREKTAKDRGMKSLARNFEKMSNSLS